jgi:hypothetical protein
LTTHHSYENGKRIKSELVRADGSFVYTTNYEYDNDLLSATYKVDEKLGEYHRVQYFYDGAGNIVREESYMYDGELSGVEERSYDVNGRLVISRNLSQTTEFEYASDQHLLPSREVIRDPQRGFESERIYVMDEFGNQAIAYLDGNKWRQCKYYGTLLMEQINYYPEWGFTEFGVSRFEYERK